MSNARLSLAALLLAGALTPSLALANYTFSGFMSAAEEVPTNISTGKAVGTVQIINGSPDSLRVNVSYSGLTSNAQAAHVHGLAPRGTNTGVLFTLTVPGGTSGTIANQFAITAQQKRDILYGLTYLNIHTVNFGGGEIRGQIDSVTSTAGKVPGSSTTGLALLTLALAAMAGIVLSQRRQTT